MTLIENKSASLLFNDIISIESFRTADFLVESAWIEHTPFAFWVVGATQPRRIVELGTHRGQSYMAFCQAVAESGSPAELFAVDTWAGDEHAGFYGPEILAELRAAHDDRYGSSSRLMQMTFAEAALEFEDGSIDLLHIDGRHYAEDVREDFGTFEPKLSERAVVLFHDTNVFEHGFGVHEVWAELSQQYPSFEFKHGHGLGVLAYGTETPDSVLRFLEAGSTDSGEQVIRSSYSRLGQATADAYFASLTAQLNDDRMYAMAQRDALLIDVSNLQQMLAEANAESTRLHAKVGRLQTKFEATKEKNTSLRQQLAGLQNSTAIRLTRPLYSAKNRLKPTKK